MWAAQARPGLSPAPHPHPRSPRPPHAPGFQVDTAQVGAASTPHGREHVPQQFCPGPCSRAGRGRSHHAAVTLSLATRGRRDHAEEAVGVRGPVPRKPRGEEEGRGRVDPFLRSCARGTTARVEWDRPGGHPRRVPRREAEPKAKEAGSPAAPASRPRGGRRAPGRSARAAAL